MKKFIILLFFFLLFQVDFLAQNSEIENQISEIERQIEDSPENAENYLKRGDLYFALWEKNKDSKNIVYVAQATADYSKFLKLKPNDVEVLQKRFTARQELFLGANPFSIKDLQKLVKLTKVAVSHPDYSKHRAFVKKLAEMQKTYSAIYKSQKCVNARSLQGFQGHPADEPITALGLSLDSSIDEDFENQLALKTIACGANVNYVYKKGNQTPELGEVLMMKTEHLIAMLEAGGNTEITDKFGNTILMIALQNYLKKKNSENLSFNLAEKIKILLHYGANPNARNRQGKTLLYFAEKTENKEIISIIQKAIKQ